MNRISTWRAGALAVSVLAGAAIALPSPSGAQAGRPLDLFFVDTEGGAATLIVTQGGESVLIDSGWPREDGRDAKRIEHVARYVAGVSQIDHYVTTHWHTDHYGGIEYLAKLMPVRHYYDHGIPPAAEDDSADFTMLMPAYKRASGGKSQKVKAGDTIALRQAGAPLSLKIVAADGKVEGEGKEGVPTSCKKHVPAPVPDESDNKRSVSVLLNAGNFGYLNCGDLTWNIEHKLACPKNRVGQVDLWQVTHHGWEASGNPALVEAMQPRVAMMVNGAKKGASPRTIQMIKKSPSIEALYQLHRALGNTPADNTTPERIANTGEEEGCKGEFMHVQLNSSGDRYTVYKGADKQLQTFQVR